jgi:hypothetical protein
MSRDDDETIRLLTEIRDLHREHLDEYRKNLTRMMDTQDRAIQMQALSVKRQRYGLLIVIGMVLFLVFFVFLVAK